jgi:glutaredoxin
MSEVVVYSSAGCYRCVALKRMLRKAGVSFVEKRVDDVDVATELAMHNVVSVPALRVGGLLFECRDEL